MLPPGEGGAESYFNNIIKRLPQTNMAAFNNYYLHSKRLRTFEELAEMYLDIVRGIQPHGPYHFIGWSFGGILAMEISRRLVASDEKVGFLGIIDTYFNDEDEVYDDSALAPQAQGDTFAFGTSNQETNFSFDN